MNQMSVKTNVRVRTKSMLTAEEGTYEATVRESV